MRREDPGVHFAIEPAAVLAEISELSWFPRDPPWLLLAAGEDEALDPAWLARVLREPLGVRACVWRGERSRPRLVVRPGVHSTLVHPRGSLSLERLVASFEGLSFLVCAIGPIMSRNDEERRGSAVPPLEGNHPAMGVGCAFRGEGHRRLVSRRWLGHGPWALLRSEVADLSVILFHDPDLSDPAAASTQATPGHRRIRDGYMGPGSEERMEIAGTYLDSERRLVVVVHGREVSEAEMLDACALRRDSQSTDRPIDTVSYVFVDEAEARAHLHALWLRELECRCVVDGVEVRLDAGYAPEPVVPSWVPAVCEKWQKLLDPVAPRSGP